MPEPRPIVHLMPGRSYAKTHCCGLRGDQLPIGDRLTPLSHKTTCQVKR